MKSRQALFNVAVPAQRGHSYPRRFVSLSEIENEEGLLFAGGQELEDNAVLFDAQAKVRQAVATLPPQFQEIAYLHFWEDLTPKKIAPIVGMNPHSVSNRLVEIKKRLRASPLLADLAA